MSIRLNKICREFNIGITAAITELEKNGIFQYEANPNTKISDEHYELLVRTFGKGIRLQALPWREDNFGTDPEANREEVNSHSWNNMRNDTIIVMPTRYILIPKDQNCDYFSFWTYDDFITNCPGAIVDGKIIRERLKNPTGTIPVMPYIPEPIEHNLVEKPQEVFKVSNQDNATKVSVLGSIDLSALNTSTRPKKKTKEERMQERQARKAARQTQKQPEVAVPHGASKYAIRDIWQRFVDIQEKLIKQRCSPISIDPNSVEVENDKLYVTVDESWSKQQIDSIFREKLGVEDYDLESGSILVDEGKWDALSESDMVEIRHALSECYIELDTTPAINVTISYANDMGRSDQLSIEDLCQLDAILKMEILSKGILMIL